MFSKQPSKSPEERVQAITSSLQIWPQSEFYVDRALALREVSSRVGNNWAQTEEIKQSTEDFASAHAMNPYDPSITINQANLLSALGKDVEAEEAYEKTLAYQGEMESAFLGHFYYAQHLYRKGIRHYRAGELTEALGTLGSAADQIDKSTAIIPWNEQDLRVEIYSSIGIAREAIKDYKGAQEIYEFTCTIPRGHVAHFRIALLLRRIGVEAWENRRSSDALAYFIEARRIAATHGNIPESFTGQQRGELLSYLESKIAFLQQTNVTPTQGLIK